MYVEPKIILVNLMTRVTKTSGYVIKKNMLVIGWVYYEMVIMIWYCYHNSSFIIDGYFTKR